MRWFLVPFFQRQKVIIRFFEAKQMTFPRLCAFSAHVNDSLFDFHLIKFVFHYPRITTILDKKKKCSKGLKDMLRNRILSRAPRPSFLSSADFVRTTTSPVKLADSHHQFIFSSTQQPSSQIRLLSSQNTLVGNAPSPFQNVKAFRSLTRYFSTSVATETNSESADSSLATCRRSGVRNVAIIGMSTM